MSFTELLKTSRASRVSVLHKFLTSYDPGTSRVYGFVEGEADQAFYRAHFHRYVPNPKDVYVYNCEGKDNVYIAYKDVLGRYPNCDRVLFFVDKDVDDIIGKRWPADPRIFVTDYYSIENYIVCRDLLTHYFQDFMKVRGVELQVDAVLAEFDRGLNEFYRLILPVMAWIVVARRAGHRVRLQDVNLRELFTVSDSGISRVSRRSPLAYLCRVTQIQSSGSVWRQMKSTCIELNRLGPKTYVRGKFEAWWFIEFGRRISESVQRVAADAGGSVSFSVQLTQANFVQVLSSRSPTPKELETFMNFHLGRFVGTARFTPEQRSKGLSFFRRLIGFLK